VVVAETWLVLPLFLDSTKQRTTQPVYRSGDLILYGNHVKLARTDLRFGFVEEES
jgi:hypothetical protein